MLYDLDVDGRRTSHEAYSVIERPDASAIDRASLLAWLLAIQRKGFVRQTRKQCSPTAGDNIWIFEDGCVFCLFWADPDGASGKGRRIVVLAAGTIGNSYHLPNSKAGIDQGDLVTLGNTRKELGKEQLWKA